MSDYIGPYLGRRVRVKPVTWQSKSLASDLQDFFMQEVGYKSKKNYREIPPNGYVDLDTLSDRGPRPFKETDVAIYYPHSRRYSDINRVEVAYPTPVVVEKVRLFKRIRNFFSRIVNKIKGKQA